MWYLNITVFTIEIGHRILEQNDVDVQNHDSVAQLQCFQYDVSLDMRLLYKRSASVIAGNSAETRQWHKERRWDDKDFCLVFSPLSHEEPQLTHPKSTFLRKHEALTAFSRCADTSSEQTNR